MVTKALQDFTTVLNSLKSSQGITVGDQAGNLPPGPQGPVFAAAPAATPGVPDAPPQPSMAPPQQAAATPPTPGYGAVRGPVPNAPPPVGFPAIPVGMGITVQQRPLRVRV